MKKADLDLYTDYLLSTFGAATATGLSAMVEGAGRALCPLAAGVTRPATETLRL
ncbi:MAG: hypothetical protein Q7K57_57355 [Burkholderiaceae bacterium]|nr:hypothetical protein [Burkholderiaceae bacterium]